MGRTPSPIPDSSTDSQRAQRRFATTRWSIVVAAAGPREEMEPQHALATRCESYWYPVYTFVRRRGYSPADAEDSTQAFFAALLEKGYVESADRTRGRFRTFLLTAVTRFLAKARERSRAQKRGGGKITLSIDASVDESRYSVEPVIPS